MKLLLERDVKAPFFTLGKMSVDGKHHFFTVEDKIREIPGVPVAEWKVPGQTAIPYGNYRVIKTFSNRFQKHLPLLLDVPGFTGIRIHSGNTDKDTEGCLCIGTGRTREGVSNSRYAMDILLNLMEEASKRGEVITIEIR